jgi:hypothetical protein
MYVWNISFLKAGQSITEVGPNISSFVTKILHISLSQHMKKIKCIFVTLLLFYS